MWLDDQSGREKTVEDVLLSESRRDWEPPFLCRQVLADSIPVIYRTNGRNGYFMLVLSQIRPDLAARYHLSVESLWKWPQLWHLHIPIIRDRGCLTFKGYHSEFGYHEMYHL